MIRRSRRIGCSVLARKVLGLDQLKRKLAAMPIAARTEIRKALDVSAEEMAATARALAPVDTGALKASIEKAEGRHDLEVLVRAGGPATGLAVIVEYGHDNAAARPFFWPAYRSLRRRIRSRLNRAIRSAARKVASL
jgi:HK97 gp10 family phage protein